MLKLYFTYRTENLPFDGGWTEVEAPTANAAILAFRAFHPDQHAGILNCSDTYLAENFERTEMFRDGIRGYRCREVITLRRKAANY